MATNPGPDAGSILFGAVARLPAVLSALAAAAASRRAGAIAAAHAIIRRHAGRAWTVAIESGSDEFSIRTAGTRVLLGENVFGGMLASVVAEIDATDDGVVAGIYAKLGDPDQRRQRATDLVMSMFLAHEFFHIEQQLGSDQYRDSDAYGDAVAAVDFQADVAAISYVAGLRPHADLVSPHELLTLLTTLHIFTMNAFASSMSRDAFDRLLVWHFQAARIARATSAPDMLHPALQQRPTISLPQFRAVTGDVLTEASFTVRRNDEGGTKLDLIVAAADGSGIVRLFRLAATDDGRVRRLAVAIVGRRLSEVRQELEEFFLSHASAMEFRRPDTNRVALESVVSIGTRLIERPAGTVTLDDGLANEFFERAEFLLGRLPKYRVEDRKSTRLNSSHLVSRMPSSA